VFRDEKMSTARVRKIVKKFLKWTGFVVAGIVGVALLALGWLYFASEGVLSREYAVADTTSLVIPTDAAGIAEGRRIAWLAGCQHCHGEKLNGGVVDDIPNFVRLVAPNISVLLPRYTDAQLATVLRKGVKPDGHSVLFMPSEMFRHLSDAELARMIAYLRTVPATPEGVREKTEVRILARLILAKGDYQPAALAMETLPPPVTSSAAGDPVSQGRHLTMTFCSECHGQDLGGFAPLNSPPLAVAKGYSLAQFARLMNDGVALGDRPLRIMSDTARVRFAKFTPAEVAAVHAFLRSL
jgi:mono/diheme cytochrome c family protein